MVFENLKKALVVDDDSAWRDITSRVLAGLGLEVESVADGLEAVEACRTGAFDVVFMDCCMPRMDGYEAAQGIRALDLAHGQPIIVACTSNDEFESQWRSRNAGMDGLLAKPVCKQTVLTLFSRLLGVSNIDDAPQLRRVSKVSAQGN